MNFWAAGWRFTTPIMTKSFPSRTLQNGLQKLLSHEEEDFLCSSFSLLSFWLSVGQVKLKPPWLSGALTVTMAFCLWDMHWCRHTNSSFYGTVEANLPLNMLCKGMDLREPLFQGFIPHILPKRLCIPRTFSFRMVTPCPSLLLPGHFFPTMQDCTGRSSFVRWTHACHPWY